MLKSAILPKFWVLFLFAVITSQQAAHADIVVKFTETGSGVTIEGSGSIETLDGLSYLTSTDIVAANQYVRNSIVVHIRSAVDTMDWYETTFTSFSNLGVTRPLQGDPGVEFGIVNTSTIDRVYLPSNYAAGDTINFSVTNVGDSLADFGLTAGDIWGATWNTGNLTTPTESIIFLAVDGVSNVVPEPSSAILYASAAFGLIGRTLLKRRSRA